MKKCAGTEGIMTCFEAQSLIVPFIDETLEHDKLEQFLNHIKSCDSCRDDFEVYFTLLNGMKQLDENKNIVNSFQIDIEGFLHKQEEKINQRKARKIKKRIILYLFMLLLGLWLG